MATALNVNIQFNVNSASQTWAFSRSASLVPSAAYALTARQSIGTGAAEALTKGEITTVRYLSIINEDATNTVTLYSDSGGTTMIATLGPGEPAAFGPNISNVYAKAAGGACIVAFTMCDA